MLLCKQHGVYWAIIATLGAFSLYQTWGRDFSSPKRSDSQLYELTLCLHRARVPLRVVPQRKDGLLIDAMLLTETDKSVAELQHLPIDATRPDLWRGTVLVLDDSNKDFACDTTGWGDNGLRLGPLLLFGDRAILERIRKVYEN